MVRCAAQRESRWRHHSARTFRRNPWHRCQPPDEDKGFKKEAQSLLTKKNEGEVKVKRGNFRAYCGRHRSPPSGSDFSPRAKKSRAVMSSSTLLAHSDLLRPIIFGQEWLRRLDACVRKSPDHRQARATYQLRMTTTWTQVVLNIVLLLFDSSSLAVSSVCLLSWRKTASGDTVSGWGSKLLHRSCKMGLSEKRAQWFQRWMTATADAGYVHMSAFEEGSGRVMYVAGALEFERPFFSPLYRFLTLHPRTSVRRLLCSHSGTSPIGFKSRDITTVLQSLFHRILLLGSMLKPVTVELEWEVGARFSTKLASRTGPDLDRSVWRKIVSISHLFSAAGTSHRVTGVARCFAGVESFLFHWS